MIGFHNKKGDMTIPVIIAIVIGLTILVIMIYVFAGKSRVLSDATGCEQAFCKESQEQCDSGYTKSFTPCSYKDTNGAKHSGRCCVQEDYS